MRTFIKRLFAISVFISLFVNGYSTENTKMKTPEQGDTTKVLFKNQSAIRDTSTIYTCPMHPEVIFNTPGKCPKCGMDLVVKNANSGKHKHRMMGCMGMMHSGDGKGHVWMFIAGGVVMVVMMVVLVLR